MQNSDKIILDLCGASGAWSAPYKEAGYDVRVITLPMYNVLDYNIPGKVYGILAAPPCCHFAVSGAVYFKQKDSDGRTLEGTKILTACLMIIAKAQPKYWCIENPVGRMYRWLGDPVMRFNPSDYGDPWTKKTCLWGTFNKPKKKPIPAERFISHNILSQTVSDNQIKKLIECHYLPENYKELYGDIRDRKAIRAITPPGFAKAFFKANQ